MNNHFNDKDILREKIIGLNEKTLRKSYYPELQKRITELEKAYQLIEQKNIEIEASKNLVEKLFFQAPGLIVVVDYEGNFIFSNENFRLLINKNISTPIKDFNLFKDLYCSNADVISVIKPAFNGKICKEFHFECTLFSDDGKSSFHNILAFPIIQNDKPISVVVIFEDVTEQVLAEKKIYKLAYFDLLTGLPNRMQILEKIDDRISYSRRYKTLDALMILNIDRFKVINEIHGNIVGDEIISLMGERIKKTLRDVDFLGRIGADEFAILLPCEGTDLKANSSTILSIAERIRKISMEKISVNKEFLNITSSIGITFYPEDSVINNSSGNNKNYSHNHRQVITDTPQEVIRRANTALFRAKDAGGNRTAFFEHTMEQGARNLYQLERDLSEASLHSQFELYLQPQVAYDKTVVGAECLIRWNHPNRGIIFPYEFIPIAERSNLIITIGEWVLRKACSLLQNYFNSYKNFSLSVNISPAHFAHSHFEHWITELFSFYSIHPNSIILEITEGILLENEKYIIEKMMHLASLGFKFSIDDFGTGYSSLAYLKRLSLSEIKIDKSFVQDAPIDPNNAILVETIIAVAHKMGLTLVAEGVETEEQLNFLLDHHDMIFQGYYFGKPIPVEKFLEEHSPKIV